MIAPLVLFGALTTVSPQGLEADIASRVAEAKRELGGRTRVQIVENVFVLIMPAGQGDSTGTALLTERVLRAYFHGRFDTRPAQPVSVYLFGDPRTYEGYCRSHFGQACGTPFGFYGPDERRIVMNVGLGIGTLTHELVHPIVQSDFPGAPQWLNEGIASLFEALRMPAAGEIHGVKNWRHPRLLRALRSRAERDKASLTHLFALDDAGFRDEDEDLNYATARYFCQWLDERGKLWPFYRHFRDHRDQDPRGEHAFAAVMGKTPAAADVEWQSWVKRL